MAVEQNSESEIPRPNEKLEAREPPAVAFMAFLLAGLT
jgi:hypothetical protein